MPAPTGISAAMRRAWPASIPIFARRMNCRAQPTSVRHGLCFSCRFLHWGTSTTCATTLSRSRGGRPKIKYDLSWPRLWKWWRLQELGDRPSVHEVCSDQPSEGERAFDNFVGVMGQAQQHKGAERDHNLN